MVPYQQQYLLNRKLLAGANGGNIEAAKFVGAEIAKKSVELGHKKVTFDRSGYKYHGRVKALAEAARDGGLEFQWKIKVYKAQINKTLLLKSWYKLIELPKRLKVDELCHLRL